MAKGCLLTVIDESGAIYCDCCGQEKIAEVKGNKLVIKVRRHGRIHLAVISFEEILDKLEKSVYSLTNSK